MARQRGVSSLIVDQPGTGEALRLHGMTRLQHRGLGEPYRGLARNARRRGRKADRHGGRLARRLLLSRAVAFEPRFACGVVWGANHDWRDVQKKRLQREGNFPVPHYWKHVCWVWGAKDIDDFMRIAEDVHLDGVVSASRCRSSSRTLEGLADSRGGRIAPTSSS
jgi:hypothetical protein